MVAVCKGTCVHGVFSVVVVVHDAVSSSIKIDFVFVVVIRCFFLNFIRGFQRFYCHWR